MDLNAVLSTTMCDEVMGEVILMYRFRFCGK